MSFQSDYSSTRLPFLYLNKDSHKYLFFLQMERGHEVLGTYPVLRTKTFQAPAFIFQIQELCMSATQTGIFGKLAVGGVTLIN